MKMKKRTLIIVAAVFGFFLINCNAIAGYLDPDSGWENLSQYNSTQNDGYGNNTPSSWQYKYKEDNEVEPNAVTGQQWDLEGFFLSDGTNEDVPGNTLALVGGFDFASGVDGVGAGDIFIDAELGNDYYEYVMDLNFGSNTYDLIQLDPGKTDEQIQYVSQSGVASPLPNPGVVPYKYSGGGYSLGSFALTYLHKDDSNIGAGLTGGSHDIVLVNLGFLAGNTNFEVLNTMACGNDVVFGAGSTTAAVPEPATIFLLGSGLLGLFGYRKKMKKTNI